jgi:hypothetical protein
MTNFRPSDDNVISSIFQVSQRTVRKQLLELEAAVQEPPKANKFDDPEDFVAKDMTGISLSSPTAGYDLRLYRESQKEIKVNLMNPSAGPTKLSKLLLSKYGPESEHYPDLEKKRRDLMLDNDKLRQEIRTSWWGQHIVKHYGIDI